MLTARGRRRPGVHALTSRVGQPPLDASQPASVGKSEHKDHHCRVFRMSTPSLLRRRGTCRLFI
uniref:Uncharacterized protein n=1 Tax=Ralstonia solanacearum TaxID=305 RepID=A0A0S4VSB6_RALSL|nr:protein of unknown function [Ralstonia solanacearum]